jgi:hypothetical protein
LTVLLEDKLSRPRAEPKAPMSVEEWHRKRVRLAVMAAIQETAESAEESAEEYHRRCAETLERLEQPEQVETIDAWPAEIAVARLCHKYGLPLDVGRWLYEADDLLDDEMELEEDRSAASPGRGSATRRRPRAPDTG